MEEAMALAMDGSHEDESGVGGGGGGFRCQKNTWQLITQSGKTVVATYRTAEAAAKASGANPNSIGQVCLGHLPSAKGYYWRRGPAGGKLSIDCQDEDSTRAAYHAAVERERVARGGDDEPIGKLIALE